MRDPTEPAPSPAGEAADQDPIRSLVEPHFDAAFYLASGPDLTQASGDPLGHFLEWGWREGRDPNPGFDVAFYLASNPDVSAACVHPFVHYLQFGRSEGRPPQDGPAAIPLQLRALVEPHFDPDFYHAADPDLTSAGGHGLAHFLRCGWREGRNPNAGFDVVYYLAANPDVAEAGLNPFVHYLCHGRREGRLPRKPADPWRATLDAAWARRRARAVAIDVSDWITAETLAARLEDVAGGAGLVISLSHDDYAVNSGGVQLVVGREQRACNAAGLGYLHLSPLAGSAALALAPEGPADTAAVALRLDGERVGVARFDVLLAVVERLASSARLHVFVHHLAGHAPELVAALIDAAGPGRPVFWVHDFFTVCPSTFLLRNDVSFCGAPATSSPACTICCYGSERGAHRARLQRLFDATAPTVLAPSAFTLAFWRQHAGLRHAAGEVMPLGRLRPAGWTMGHRGADRGRQVHLAFVGAPTFHKGWPVFEALAERLASDSRYAFFHFGRPATPPVPANIVNVSITGRDADSRTMIEALQAHDIAAVVCWSLCQETFSFAAHEALASGAFLIVREGTGHVWPAVVAHAPDQGCQIRDDQELEALVQSDAFHASLLESPRRRFTFDAGDATADWLRAASRKVECLNRVSMPAGSAR